MRHCLRTAVLFLLSGSTFSGMAAAADWPQFLGPTRNGIAAADEKLPDNITCKKVWQLNVGAGYAGPAVHGGRLYVVHRIEEEDEVLSLDAATGKTLWSFRYGTDYRDQFDFDAGPRAVPAVKGGKVFVHGAQGKIHCLDATTGKKIWAVDGAAEFGSDKGYFGRVCSPLVDRDLVLIQVGGPNGEGIVGLRTADGKKVWGATDHEAGYSSPILADIEGKRTGLFFTRAGLVALEPKTGKIQFEFPWRSRMQASVNVATPIVSGNQIFLSACYQTGAALIEIKNGAAQKIWSGDNSLSCHYTNAVLHQGALYGFHGRQERRPELRCVDWKTGDVVWKDDRFGSGSVTLADGKLLVLTERGQLFILPASRTYTKANPALQMLGRGVRAYPALANGMFYGRDEKRLVGVRLSGN